MMRRYCLPGATGLILILFLFGSAYGVEDACRWESPHSYVPSALETVLQSGDKDTYSGTIRVYVTEIIGRWEDAGDSAFHNAFLSFALQEGISLTETDTLSWNLEWDGNDFGFGDIQEDNIKVMAAVFNSAGYTGYSDPPSGQPFTVHEVDACAGATSGTTGYNEVTEDFTHSVLVEDGSTTS